MADTHITDAEIASMMGWRGPGANTAASLRRIRQVIDHVLRAERAAAPSPSTAPEAWVYECKQPHTDPVIWAEFFGRQKPSDALYIRNARPLYGAALASRPAEVDDEGLPPLPPPTRMVYERPHGALELLYYTADQLKQGQRDAVAVYRARSAAGGAQ